jgi:hypothetical protein
MLRSAPILLIAAPAGAHPGHIETVAGHDHWVLGATLGTLAGAAVIAWVKGRRAREEPEPDEVEPDADAAEGTA